MSKGVWKTHTGISPLSSRRGRSTGVIDCPFCGTEVVVFLWSVSGKGKKCPTCPDTIILSKKALKRA